MFTLSIHTDAQRDLDAIDARNPQDAADLIVFLQELSGDQHLLSRLNEHGYSVIDTDDWVAGIDVSRWQSQWNRGKNLWRLKCWELENDGVRYRIVYAFKPQTSCYHVLGIFHRSEFDYESNNPRTERILRAYSDL